MDTTLSVLILLVQLALGTLGVYVSMRPPSTEKHWKFIGAFCFLGVLGIVLTIAQGVRNSRAQERLTQELAAIKRNTEQPPRLTFNVPPATVINGGKSPTDEATERRHRSIQDKISKYMDAGNSLRITFTPGVPPSQEQQHAWSMSVDKWHASIENYIKTIPRGSIYLVRFRDRETGNAVYPGGGMTSEWYEHWDLLSSDLARLEDFLKDPELGAP
jgi:hypothetical protein